MEITRLDAVFPVMHGRFAEDGSMQGLCDLAGIPCVGPGVCSSAICMDKEYTHIVLDAAGIKTSDWFCVRKGEVPSLLDLEVKIAVKLGGFPVFVQALQRRFFGGRFQGQDLGRPGRGHDARLPA